MTPHNPSTSLSRAASTESLELDAADDKVDSNALLPWTILGQMLGFVKPDDSVVLDNPPLPSTMPECLLRFDT